MTYATNIMRKLGKKLGKPPEVWMSPEFTEEYWTRRTEEYWTRRKRPSLTANPGRADGSCVADSMMARMEHDWPAAHSTDGPAHRLGCTMDDAPEAA
jgi:hypothetical protein